MPVSLRQQLGELAGGNFVDRGVNVLAFRNSLSRLCPVQMSDHSVNLLQASQQELPETAGLLDLAECSTVRNA